MSNPSAKINQTHKQERNVIAVGTTVVRTLESVADEDGKICEGHGYTRLHVDRNHKLTAVDALLTRSESSGDATPRRGPAFYAKLAGLPSASVPGSFPIAASGFAGRSRPHRGTGRGYYRQWQCPGKQERQRARIRKLQGHKVDPFRYASEIPERRASAALNIRPECRLMHERRKDLGQDRYLDISNRARQPALGPHR